MRQQEQSEWEVANPAPEELKADASKLERMTAEHLRLIREIRRMTKDDRFTGYCCFELADRPMEVLDSFDELLPSLDNEHLKYVHMRHGYRRDNNWMNASVYFESQRVGILVEGTNPLWVASAADLLEKAVRVGRPKWGSLVSRWGYWLSQFVFACLVGAVFWRVTNGLGGVSSWWGLPVGAVLISFLAIGNPKFLDWLLPKVDIYPPVAAPTGSTHLKWVGTAVAAAVLGIAIDILLRG
jgi:hypothetical protein